MKCSPLRKRSKDPYKTLRRKARTVFAKWIVNRDKYRCITCGAEGNQAGHFFHRDCLDFDEFNNNCQCRRCNYFLSGNLAVYASRLTQKYGNKIIGKLERKANTPKRFTVEELEKIIKKYS